MSRKKVRICRTGKWIIGTVAAVFLISGSTNTLTAKTTAQIPVENWEVAKQTLAEAISKRQSSSTDSLASANVNKEKALEIATEFAQIPEGYELIRSEFDSRSYPREMPVWRFYWEEKEEKNEGRIDVSVDAINGAIVGFDWRNGGDETVQFPPKYDREAALKMAEEYVKKQFSSYMEQTKREENAAEAEPVALDGRTDYRFTYVRTVNGIPFPDNFIRLVVNGNGTLTDVDFRWDHTLTFPDAEAAISEREAEEELLSVIPIQMEYIRVWKNIHIRQENDSALFFGYHIPRNIFDLTVDADTGALLDAYGDETESLPEQDIKPLVDKPLKLSNEAKGQEWTQQEGEDIVKKTLSIDEDFSLEAADYTQTDDRSTWDFRWMKEAAQAEDERYIRVTLDAQTGEILRYYKRVNREEAEEREEKKRIGKDKAREKAVQFVKQLAPGYAHRVFLQETLQPEYRWEEVPREFSFTFRQLANGVPVQNRGISVSIDAYTGELTNFHIDWDRQTTYPEVPPHTLSPEEAKALLFKNLDVELQYVFPREKFWLAERRDEAGGERTLKLVYQLKSKAFEAQELFLDAVTGQWRRFDDGEIVRGDELPEDVKGHWAEKELQLMFQYNAFEVENNRIDPDEPVKRGELIKMLMLALHEGDFYYAYDSGTKAYYNDVSQESAYFGYVQAAAESHILDTTKEELNPEEVVDREEMAVLITRALGYGGVAEYEHIFHLPFADADQIEAKGHVAIVSGLKIMRGSEDNRFMPHKEATRAQAAAAFYRFLQKRVELHP